jgi:hypothetical protein
MRPAIEFKPPPWRIDQRAGKICLKEARKKTYDYVFGEFRNSETILNDLKGALSLERAPWT